MLAMQNVFQTGQWHWKGFKLGLLSIFVLSMSLAVLAQPVSAALDSWTSTTSYPITTSLENCVANSGFLSCVGNCCPETNLVYFAPLLLGGGVGSWSSSTNYPVNVAAESCVVNSGFIFCVGGATQPANALDAVYFAPLSSSGVGAWTATTSYPKIIEYQSCVVNSGFIYCIGGDSFGNALNNAVYFAPLSSSGVGAWTATTSYPTNIRFHSCVTNSGFVYCIGGDPDFGGVTSAVYFAPLSSSGVGAWTATTSYATNIESQSCVGDSGSVYCIGGFIPGVARANAVYFAALSSNGIGSWAATSSYPLNVQNLSCVDASGFMNCVAGFTGNPSSTNAVYFASVAASVGGNVVPVNALALLAPYVLGTLSLSLALAITLLFRRTWKRKSVGKIK